MLLTITLVLSLGGARSASDGCAFDSTLAAIAQPFMDLTAGVAIVDPQPVGVQWAEDDLPAAILDQVQSPYPPQPDPRQPDAPQPGEQKAEAQEPPTPPRTGIRALFGNLVEDVKHLPARQNLLLAGIGGALAGAAHPADATFNVRLRSHYDAVNTAFAPGKYIGNSVEQAVASLTTYAYGRLFDKPKVSHLGMDLVQAQILSEMLVEPIKFATRRTRPDDSNRRSFPSGHAAVTFATATVIERHLGWRKSVIGYTVASYVAASRLHDNRHYLSDVIFGAAVGAIAGRTVVHHASDYWAFAPVAVPGGAAIVVTLNR
jgi:membrane-associated phospholipid phosphatase